MLSTITRDQWNIVDFNGSGLSFNVQSPPKLAERLLKLSDQYCRYACDEPPSLKPDSRKR